MIFLIFILLFMPGLITAIFAIYTDQRKRKRAAKKLKEFRQWEKRKLK